MAGQQEYREQSELISKILSTQTNGKHIYLLGSAEFGPTNEPILINSTVGLYNKFGKQGTLIDAFHALKYTSKDNLVYLVKTTGEHATAYLNVNIPEGEIIQDGLTFVSSESNELFNDILIVVDVDCITFKFPKELGMSNRKYYYKDYKTIEEFANAINKETKNHKNYIYAYYSVDPATSIQNAFYVCNPLTIHMYGGQCGLGYTKDLLYNCLERTYDILESHDIDIIIPVDAFMDDIYPDDAEASEFMYNRKYYQSTKDYLTEDFFGRQLSFMDQLIQFCARQLNFGLVTNGIIGYNSSYKYWSYYLSDADEIAQMYKACYDYNLSCCRNPFYAFLVSIVGGDIKYNKGTIIDNGYLAYAALCANTIITSGTTNTPISNSISLYHEFSENVLKEMADSGIVTFRHSPLYDTPVVYDGITGGIQDENLKLFCNVRMIQMCMSYVNKLFQGYIGKNLIELIEDKIIEIGLETILESLSRRNIITDYSYTIVPSYSTGEAKVYLNLTTCYMVKPIQLCSVVNVEFEEEWNE